MKIEIESTTKIVEINGVPARIWEGATLSGVPVHCYVTRIAVREDAPPEEVEQFERELKECAQPSADVRYIPLRMIL